MKIKIKRVWNADLGKYREELEKFNIEWLSRSLAYVEIKDIDDLFELVKQLDCDIYICSFENNIIQIYDDYIE